MGSIGRGREAEREDQRRGDSEGDAHAAERLAVVAGRRMTEAVHCGHAHHQHRPGRPAERSDRQGHGADDGCGREPAGASAEERVSDVPAIELAEREQVQRRGQQAEPRGQPHRVHVERVAVGDRSPKQALDQREEQRVAEHQAAAVVRQRDDLRSGDASRQQRHGDDEPGQGPRYRDVEEGAGVRDRFAQANERAERAGERQRRGEEPRERGVHVVIAAGQVVSQLVRAEDAEHRQAEGEPANPEGQRRCAPGRGIGAGGERRPMEGADERRRREGQQQRQHVPGDWILPARPLRRRSEALGCHAVIHASCDPKRTYPMFWRSLPGLNRMVRPGGIRTSRPVRGLRPMPRLRGLT